MARHINEYRAVRDVRAPSTVHIATAEVDIGATGAPTIASGNGDPGISISRSGTGVYAVTFPKSRRATLQVVPLMATPDDVVVTIDDDFSASAGTCTFTHFSAAGSAADPANGDRLFLVFHLYGSQAP